MGISSEIIQSKVITLSFEVRDRDRTWISIRTEA